MYNKFAEVYDKLQEIDYSSFVDYYLRIFSKFNITPSLILDLACGTGNVTIPMSKLGYDMIGVDLSAEMLNIAAEKARNENTDILFLNQDMTEFELYGTVDAAICALDGINYLTNDGDLDKLFALIHNYLNPGGLFIFDINSEYKLRHILGENTYVYDEDGIYCVWESFFDEDKNICSFCLDIFSETEDGKYTRSQEFQEERSYSVHEIISSAERNGLSVEGCFDDRTFENEKNSSERIFFVLKKY